MSMFVSFHGFNSAEARVYQHADGKWYGQLTLLNDGKDAEPEHVTLNFGPKTCKEDIVAAVFEAAQDISDAVTKMQLEESIKDKEEQEPPARVSPDAEEEGFDPMWDRVSDAGPR